MVTVAALSESAVARMAIKIKQGDCATTEERNPAFEQNLQHPSEDLVFATSQKDNPNQLKWWKIHPLIPGRRTPYWILQVPKAIIPNHTPIFTPEGRAMMAALFRMANPTDRSGLRQFREVSPRSD